MKTGRGKKKKTENSSFSCWAADQSDSRLCYPHPVSFCLNTNRGHNQTDSLGFGTGISAASRLLFQAALLLMSRANPGCYLLKENWYITLSRGKWAGIVDGAVKPLAIWNHKVSMYKEGKTLLLPASTCTVYFLYVLLACTGYIVCKLFYSQRHLQHFRVLAVWGYIYLDGCQSWGIVKMYR